jgi:hypothetical protein
MMTPFEPVSCRQFAGLTCLPILPHYLQPFGGMIHDSLVPALACGVALQGAMPQLC